MGTHKIFLHLSLISSLIVIVWHKTLNQGLWGDGFYWFNPLLRDYHLFPLSLSNPVYNPAARMIYDIVIPLFKGNEVSYQAMQIVFLIVLTVVVYFVVLKLTKKISIAFISCILFISNYGGMYEMMAEGNLNRFLDRVPNLIIVVAAIYFLASFVETRKIRSLVLSWAIYLIGIYLGHFSSFVLPFFIIFPAIHLSNRKKIMKSLIVITVITLMFSVPNFLIIRNSEQRAGFSFSYYLDPEQKFIEKTFLMTTPLIIPREIVINIAPRLSIRNPYVPIVQFYTIILIPTSIVIGYLLHKKNKNLAKLYVSCILTMLAGTAIMIYTDPIKFDPYKNFGAGRHVFIQSIFYSIALASVLITLLEKHKRVFIPIILLFLTIFVTYNTNLSWRDIAANQYLYVGNRRFFAYIQTLYPKFNPDTVVILGSRLMHSNSYLNVVYGPPNVNYVSAPEDIQKILHKDKNNVYLIDVNYNPTPNGYFLPERVRIDDFTNLYRSKDINLDLVATWGTQKVTWFEALNTQK